MSLRTLLLTAAAAAGLVLPAVASAEIPGPEQRFAVTREGDPGLPGHTIFRPTDVGAPRFRLPIVVWGNGGCRDSNEQFRTHLTGLAAMGYFVVANGAPENPYVNEELGGLVSPQPHLLVEAIDWAVAQDTAADSRFRGRLDTTRILTMGQSCGAGEALTAAGDPRVDATLAWNSYLGDPGVLHAPVLYVSGGAGDYTVANTEAQYHRTDVSAVLADYVVGGHDGFFRDPTDGSPSPAPMQAAALHITEQWVSATVYGRAAAAATFLGDACALCTAGGWTVRQKHWEGFVPVASEAPAIAAPAACPLTRRVTVRLPRGAARAVVYVDGRRRTTLRPGRTTKTFAVDARAPATIRVVGRTAGGRRVVTQRRTRGCG